LCDLPKNKALNWEDGKVDGSFNGYYFHLAHFS
jgi:hypothetical protein